MNASSKAVEAAASVELTTPAKSTPNPTTAIASAPSQGVTDAAVPMQMRTAPTRASAA